MKKVAALAFSLILFFLATSDAFAADIKLEPGNFLIQSTAGQTIREAVTIRNLSPTSKNLKLTWEGYSLPQGEFGSREGLKQHSINFAALSQTNLELQPFEVTSAEIEFKIPKAASPADYYGALTVLDQDSKAQTDFTIRLLGKIEEKVDITSLSINNSSLSISIANDGNQTVDIKADIKIQNLFGQVSAQKTTKQRLKAAQQKNLSLEHENLLPGYYQAKVSLEYGSGRTKSSFHSFWIHPEFFLFVGLLVFIVVLRVILAKRKAHK